VSAGTIASLVAVVSLLITAAGVVGGSWRLGRNTQTVTLYRDTALAWEAKASAQEAQLEQLEADNRAKDTKIAELVARVGVLSDMVTGKSAIEAMEGQMTELLAQCQRILAEVKATVGGGNGTR
jgi:uncharacterized protein HemX